VGLWDEQDGFFYDVISTPDSGFFPLRIRSFVGLIPMLAVDTLELDRLETLPRFSERVVWFLKNRSHLMDNVIPPLEQNVNPHHRPMALIARKQLERLLNYMFDENEFLSPHGLRALSRFYHDHPYKLEVGGRSYMVDYEPAESRSGLFGGNSNWRGPIWFPINYLLTHALRKYEHHYGDSLKVEVPIGSGHMMTLSEAADELNRRLISIFLPDAHNRRPVFGDNEYFQTDPHWRDYIPFYEYFHGDTGQGLGASHQTGWTALVAHMIQSLGKSTE
jgi:hypothetical protein